MDDMHKDNPKPAVPPAAPATLPASEVPIDEKKGAEQMSKVAGHKEPKYPWLHYKPGERDISGNRIHSIHAKCDEFVIYFCKEDGTSDLYFECTDELLKTTEEPNAQLAKINRLVTEYERKRRKTLECVADAFEMWLCGQKTESLKILKDIVAQLETWRTMQGRLYYQFATLVAPVFLWIVYVVIVATTYRAAWMESLPFIFDSLPWLLAAALGATGGFFSVCLNLPKINVNTNQEIKDLWFAGATRAAVALIAAVACLLAYRGKIILGLADSGTELPPDAILTAPIMFFLFLAGFSETFIPNVLRDAEKNTPTGSGNAGGGTTAAATTSVVVNTGGEAKQT
jgi:hypothetical protein